jgi:ATP-dependent Clp protease adaptor protein ClpS
MLNNMYTSSLKEAQFKNIYNTAVEELEEVVVEELTDVGANSELIVYNDDHNTFDWVIQCFVEVIGHTFEQSEQLSLLVHYKGKAAVKTAPMNVLKPLKNELVNRGLSAVIESCD